MGCTPHVVVVRLYRQKRDKDGWKADGKRCLHGRGWLNERMGKLSIKSLLTIHLWYPLVVLTMCKPLTVSSRQ